MGGYDFILNRESPADSILVEQSINSWSWIKVGAAAYMVTDNILEVKISREVLSVFTDSLNFEFKLSDNSITDGNIMDFYVNGDAAPGGRFNFVFNTDNVAPLNEISKIPKKFLLEQNYPNPFNPRTTINYELPITNYVNLSIYNNLGQNVVTLVSEKNRQGFIGLNGMPVVLHAVSISIE